MGDCLHVPHMFEYVLFIYDRVPSDFLQQASTCEMAKRGRPDGYEDRTLLPSGQASGSHDEDFHLGSQQDEVNEFWVLGFCFSFGNPNGVAGHDQKYANSLFTTTLR